VVLNLVEQRVFPLLAKVLTASNDKGGLWRPGLRPPRLVL
jgi:hypothetical protein